MLILQLLIFTLSTFLCAAPNNAANIREHLLLPPPPATTSEAYIIIDEKTGTVLAEKNAHERMAPASLTKLMTCYVLFSGLKQGQISLDDLVHISTNAWKTEGSRLFLEENSETHLQQLIKGVIITSGNDASIALSEHFAGSEENFSIMMNRYAHKLGMHETQFKTATGLDHPDHFTSAYDLATLSQHIIEDFPEYFHWFHEQSVTHNGITQTNRNKLMFTHPEIDGLKTGVTSKAGYCLSTTAQKGNTRLIVITLGAPSAKKRDQDTLALLNYGFRFYETILLYPSNTTISSQKVYLGILDDVPLETHGAFWSTIPKGSQDDLKVNINIPKALQAPINQNEAVGELSVSLDGKIVGKTNLYPKNDVQESWGLSYYYSYLKLVLSSWI